MKYYHLCLLWFSSICLSIDNNEQCSTRDSCSNSSVISPSIYDNEPFIQSRNCFCDAACEQYGDCCHRSSSTQLNNYECIDYLSPTNPIDFKPLCVWMCTQCLAIYLGSSADIQCRNLNHQTFQDNPMLFIPVTSVQTNITYRNYFCAFCNNDVSFNIQPWEYQAFCHRNTSRFDHMILNQEEQVNYYIQNLTRNCKTTIMYPHINDSSQPSVFIRPCKKTISLTCPVGTPVDLARNCSSSSIAYRYDVKLNITYPNSYCAECNKKPSSEITCSDPILRSGTLMINQVSRQPLSILFDPNLFKYYLNSDYDHSSTTKIIYSLSYNCSKSNELYNLFLKKCSRLTDSHRRITISLKCSDPILTSEEPIRFDNGSIYLINQSTLLTKDQYVWINTRQLIFCTDQWKKSKPIFPFYRNILSMICTSISLVCLVIFIIAFYLIPSLHNLPGKCLLCLSISIFIGQLTFLTTSDLSEYTSLCFISAIFIHYFYLSSFVWLLVIAMHIYSTFNQQTVRRRQSSNENYHLFAYNLFVWCSTGMIILIACLMQLINSQSSFSPNYGHLFCSISQPNAMIVFFLLPIGCLLFIISILLVKTILAIHHSRTVAKLASASSSSSNSSFVFVYTRLASLMGLQWLLLIVALMSRQNWSWIIFEIINSLPGVFICLGFLCSQRLCSNIKRRITTKLVTRRQPTGNNITSTIVMSPLIPQ